VEDMDDQAQVGGTATAEQDMTGHPVVDGVLASLPGLDALPVAERVEVFEAAHERLRAALADAGTDG
jgi:hypothetical protein